MSALKGIGDQFFASIKSKIEMAQMNPSLKANATKRLEGGGKQAEIGARVHKTEAQRAEESATEFESLLVQQMIQSMWKAVPKNGLLSGGYEEEMYQDMLQKEVATHIAKHQSIGVKDVVLNEMLGKKPE